MDFMRKKWAAQTITMEMVSQNSKSAVYFRSFGLLPRKIISWKYTIRLIMHYQNQQSFIQVIGPVGLPGLMTLVGQVANGLGSRNRWGRKAGRLLARQCESIPERLRLRIRLHHRSHALQQLLSTSATSGSSQIKRFRTAIARLVSWEGIGCFPEADGVYPRAAM
jgi:hypothetical protein